MLKQMKEREGHLALFDILPRRFSEARPIGDIIEGIIRHLKGDPQIPAISGEGFLFLIRFIPDNSSQFARGGKEGRRFVFDDLEIRRFGQTKISAVNQLKRFSFGHPPAGGGEKIVDLKIFHLHRLADGQGIEVISDQNTRLVSPEKAGGGNTAADLRIVQNIVV